MKRLIILEHEPLTERLRQIWNIKELQSQGVDVQYWDLSRLIFPERIIPGIFEDDSVIVIKTFEEFRTALHNVDVEDALFALEIFPNWHNRRIIRELQRCGAKCFKIDFYANTSIPMDIRSRLKVFLREGIFSRLLTKICWMVYSRLYLGEIYDFVASSSKTVNPRYLIHHPDAEAFRNESVPLVHAPYIVFVDIFYPLHPDLELLSSVTEATVREYRNTMNRYFAYLEEKYQMPVVIAAHPKADYDGSEFNGRRIIAGRTGNLVKYSSMVIMHHSNSMSYIALADKPFTFVYPDSYHVHKDLLSYIESMAAYCENNAYNLDVVPFDEIKIERLNRDVKERYLDTYISSSEIKDKTNSEIMISILKEN